MNSKNLTTCEAEHWKAATASWANTTNHSRTTSEKPQKSFSEWICEAREITTTTLSTEDEMI